MKTAWRPSVRTARFCRPRATTMTRAGCYLPVLTLRLAGTQNGRSTGALRPETQDVVLTLQWTYSPHGARLDSR